MGRLPWPGLQHWEVSHVEGEGRVGVGGRTRGGVTTRDMLSDDDGPDSNVDRRAKEKEVGAATRVLQSDNTNRHSKQVQFWRAWSSSQLIQTVTLLLASPVEAKLGLFWFLLHVGFFLAPASYIVLWSENHCKSPSQSPLFVLLYLFVVFITIRCTLIHSTLRQTWRFVGHISITIVISIFVVTIIIRVTDILKRVSIVLLDSVLFTNIRLDTRA